MDRQRLSQMEFNSILSSLNSSPGESRADINALLTQFREVKAKALSTCSEQEREKYVQQGVELLQEALSQICKELPVDIALMLRLAASAQYEMSRMEARKLGEANGFSFQLKKTLFKDGF